MAEPVEEIDDAATEHQQGNLIGPSDTAMMSQRPAAETQTQRFAKQRKHSILDAAPDVATDEDYEAIEPGQRYRSPDKQIRTKPYAVKSTEDYDLVPEGAHYLDPQGQTRQKPTAEGVGYSAETLYQMARTPETKRQALRKFYDEDKIKQDTRGEFYIEGEGGKILRPGHGVSGFAGGLTAEAAPATGMLIGGQLGAQATVETGPGVLVGAGGGAMIGAAAGRQLNNVVLGLAGIHETLPDQIKSLAGEAAGVGAGELAGRAITKIPAALAATRRTAAGVRDTAPKLREKLPEVLEQLGITPDKARKFLGTTQDAAERASNIVMETPNLPRKVADFDPLFEPAGGAEPYEAAQFLENLAPSRDRPATPPGMRAIYLPGQTEPTYVRVPPSVYAPEAPMLKKIEEFDRVFRSQDVVQQSWEAFYNKQVEEILADKALGVNLQELATRATKKVSSEHAGMLAIAAAQKDMAAADAALENARRDMVELARRPVDQLHESLSSPKAEELQTSINKLSKHIQDAVDKGDQATAKELLELQDGLQKELTIEKRLVKKRAGTPEEAAARFQEEGVKRLTAAYDRAQAAAENTIQQAARNLREQVQLSIRAAAEGEDTGDLNRMIAASFRAHSVGVRARARLMYDAADTASGGARIDIAGLSEDANAFLKSMPEQVRQKYPVEIANLAKIAKVLEGETGFEATGMDIVGELGGRNAPDTTMSFGELHQLRSWFRHGIDWQDMTPDMKSGSLKFIEKKINDLLHAQKAESSSEGRLLGTNAEGQKIYERPDGRRVVVSDDGKRITESPGGLIGSEHYAAPTYQRSSRFEILQPATASPEGNLAAAAELLDRADAFYKDQIPFLSNQMVQGTIDMLKSGEGADPKVLARLFFDPNHTASMRRVRDIVGENLWKGVQAADVQHMLDQSRILGSGEIDGAKFAAQVEQRLRDGIIESAYDARTAARLQKIATDVRTLKGDLPITSDPGDTISTLMNRAALAKAEADKFAEMDPLKAMAEATAKADAAYNKAMQTARKTRQQEPLGFLAESSMSHLAVKAADKILGSQDLIMTAATQFGRDSPEFNSLRQVYAQRFLQRAFPQTAAMRAQLGGEKGMTEEVQALMFPGITRDQMVTLAKNMEFLFQAGGTDIGGSLAAASRVLHPEANFPLQVKGLKLLMQVPGASTAARYTLGKFYALAMDATTHPNFINWLAGRLQGDAFARQEARAAIQQRIKMGALLGRGFGQQMLAPQQQNEQPEMAQ